MSNQNKSVLFTEMINNPKTNREKLMQVIFEEFNVSAFYIGSQAFFLLWQVDVKQELF